MAFYLTGCCLKKTVNCKHAYWIPLQNVELYALDAEMWCKLPFGSFAEWAIVSSAALFVSGWSACIQAISTNATRRQPQASTKTLKSTVQWLLVKRLNCIPVAQKMRDFKQWRDTLQSLIMRFHFSIFKSECWAIPIAVYLNPNYCYEWSLQASVSVLLVSWHAWAP